MALETVREHRYNEAGNIVNFLNKYIPDNIAPISIGVVGNKWNEENISFMQACFATGKVPQYNTLFQEIRNNYLRQIVYFNSLPISTRVKQVENIRIADSLLNKLKHN